MIVLPYMKFGRKNINKKNSSPFSTDITFVFSFSVVVVVVFF